MNSVGRGTSPLVLPGEKCKPWAKNMVLTCLGSPVCPYSQGLEIPTYFQGNVCWYPAFPPPPRWVFPLPALALRISHRVSLGSLFIWKFFSLTTPHFVFLSVLLNRVSLGPDFLQEQVQFKFWQPHEDCFKQLWKSILGQFNLLSFRSCWQFWRWYNFWKRLPL